MSPLVLERSARLNAANMFELVGARTDSESFE